MKVGIKKRKETSQKGNFAKKKNETNGKQLKNKRGIAGEQSPT